MPIRERQRFFLREWIKFRGLTYERLADRLDTSKGVVSDLVNRRQRFNEDHLWELATALDCEPWELLNRNPLEPPPTDIETIAETVQRIPLDARQRALEAANSVLMAFAAQPTDPERTRARAKSKKRRRAA